MSSEKDNLHSFAPSMVISWVTAVENMSREQLILVCENWTEDDSAFLIEELTNQYLGSTLIGVSLTLAPKMAILRSIGYLSDREIPRLSALVSGLTLISESS